ncbi:helix-turn-helix transcriptional regulator [Rothia sp. AR01]|uniref:Helix-turn-helix transcriptional regulator n=1 Tax=Rothia santali TaxID=2949643 RepID=A0A9X2HCZ2_9MICC|nr:helix-turn-helix transcriptional regulator [Rothia santali]MCP3426000.1 helix-turn-helix transcriptional regulator [Rothia santali]
MEVRSRSFIAQPAPQALTVALRFKGMSYRQLASATGVSKTTIGNLANGRASTCSPETAACIARGLGMAPGDLFVLKAIRAPETESEAA